MYVCVETKSDNSLMFTPEIEGSNRLQSENETGGQRGP